MWRISQRRLASEISDINMGGFILQAWSQERKKLEEEGLTTKEVPFILRTNFPITVAIVLRHLTPASCQLPWPFSMAPVPMVLKLTAGLQ